VRIFLIAALVYAKTLKKKSCVNATLMKSGTGAPTTAATDKEDGANQKTHKNPLRQ